jgi:hypothetical protein
MESMACGSISHKVVRKCDASAHHFAMPWRVFVMWGAPAQHHFVCHAASFLITDRLISPANESSKVYCVSFCDGSVGDIASCTRADRNRDAPEITVGNEIGY